MVIEHHIITPYRRGNNTVVYDTRQIDMTTDADGRAIKRPKRNNHLPSLVNVETRVSQCRKAFVCQCCFRQVEIGEDILAEFKTHANCPK